MIKTFLALVAFSAVAFSDTAMHSSTAIANPILAADHEESTDLSAMGLNYKVTTSEAFGRNSD